MAVVARGQYLRQFLWGAIGYGKISDDFSNVTLDGWSPNNLKRLIIGVDGVMVQWHTTGTGAKVGRLAYFRSYGTSEDDLTSIANSVKQRRNPLKLLLDGKRVFSGIEEIVVVRGSMLIDGEMTEVGSEFFLEDLDFEKLGRLATVIEVTAVNTAKEFTLLENVQTIIKSGYRLLGDTFEGVDGALVHRVNSNWHKSKPLRPKFYSMDAPGEALSRALENTSKMYRESKAIEAVAAQDDEVSSVEETAHDVALVDRNRDNEPILTKVLGLYVVAGKSDIFVSPDIDVKSKVSLQGLETPYNAFIQSAGWDSDEVILNDNFISEIFSLVHKSLVETLGVYVSNKFLKSNKFNELNSINKIKVVEKLMRTWDSSLAHETGDSFNQEELDWIVEACGPDLTMRAKLEIIRMVSFFNLFPKIDDISEEGVEKFLYTSRYRDYYYYQFYLELVGGYLYSYRPKQGYTTVKPDIIPKSILKIELDGDEGDVELIPVSKAVSSEWFIAGIQDRVNKVESLAISYKSTDKALASLVELLKDVRLLHAITYGLATMMAFDLPVLTYSTTMDVKVLTDSLILNGDNSSKEDIIEFLRVIFRDGVL